MHSSPPIVISASRRTDIPAFYMPWFMDGIDRGYFDVVNPFNRAVSRVSADPLHVHTIVFWSKNFGPFLEGGFGERLRRAGFGLYFNFTVNSSQSQLEPHVPPLAARLEQLSLLARRFGPEAVQWRFDPICFFKTEEDGFRALNDNRGEFEQIADVAAQNGLVRCMTSFMDHYAKIDRRLKKRQGIRFVDVSDTQKKRLLKSMAASLALRGIRLRTCCESVLLAAMGPVANLAPGACIPSNQFVQVPNGRPPSMRRDTGQRRAAGCNCRLSRDIGSYADHPCHHNCLFCYANPAMDGSSQLKGESCASAQ